MIEPKIFYRELDSILAKIGKTKSNKNFFLSILSELEHRFGIKLNILKGHIYEQRGDQFLLINSSGMHGSEIVDTLAVNSKPIQLVFKHGSYIYDHPELSREFGLASGPEWMVPAAISVEGPERQWILVFVLKPGWIREEIILFLNAVRTAINFRMLSVRVGNEMEQAAQIQKSLLPKSTPQIEGYDIHECSQPAEIVGGDFYEYFQFEDESFGFSLGDASGHGLPAALLVRDVVIGLRMGLARELRFVYVLKKLNQVIQRSTYSTNFVSLFMGEIESDGHMIYVNAGHPPPFLVHNNQIIDLVASGIALGFLPDITLHRGYIRLEPNSILVMYSDGIIERLNSKDEQFGIDRLKDLVIKHRIKSAKEIIDLTFQEVFDFGNRRSWEDDATMMVIKKME